MQGFAIECMEGGWLSAGQMLAASGIVTSVVIIGSGGGAGIIITVVVVAGSGGGADIIIS